MLTVVCSVCVDCCVERTGKTETGRRRTEEATEKGCYCCDVESVS